MQRLADKVIFWFESLHEPYAVVNAMAVLIIACPCALGLATPTVARSA